MIFQFSMQKIKTNIFTEHTRKLHHLYHLNQFHIDFMTKKISKKINYFHILGHIGYEFYLYNKKLFDIKK